MNGCYTTDTHTCCACFTHNNMKCCNDGHGLVRRGQACETCGAVVGEPEDHRDWHEMIGRALITISGDR